MEKKLIFGPLEFELFERNPAGDSQRAFKKC